MGCWLESISFILRVFFFLICLTDCTSVTIQCPKPLRYTTILEGKLGKKYFIHSLSSNSQIYSTKWLVIESSEIFVIAVTLIITIVTVKSFTFFKWHIILSTINDISGPTFLEVSDISQSMPVLKLVTPTICPSKRSVTLYDCQSSHLKKFHFCRHTAVQLIEALPYKLEGHEFDSQWCNWNFLTHSFQSQHDRGVNSASGG